MRYARRPILAYASSVARSLKLGDEVTSTTVSQLRKSNYAWAIGGGGGMAPGFPLDPLLTVNLTVLTRFWLAYMTAAWVNMGVKMASSYHVTSLAYQQVGHGLAIHF